MNRRRRSLVRTPHLLAIAALAFAGSAAGAGEAILEIEGSTSLGRFGSSIGAVGDFDSDGKPDLIIGAPGVGSSESATLPPTVGFASVHSGVTGKKIAEWKGSVTGGRFGAAVTGAGDLDQDGFVDLVIGEPEANSPNVKGCGAVRAISGKSGKELFTVWGSVTGDALGAAVAAMGDVNLDGQDDFAVGMPGYDKAGDDAGGALLLTGSGVTISTAVLPGSAGLRLGTSVALGGKLGVGNVYPDLVIGGPAVAGASEGLVVGFTAKGSAFVKFGGQKLGDAFGAVVASDLDVDLDGVSDVVVGAPFEDAAGADSGALHVLSGQSGKTLLALPGGAAGDRFGASLAVLPDLDGDLVLDYAVGAAGTGTVHVVSGTNGDERMAITGPAGHGTALAWLDHDLDGLPSLAVGSPLEANGGGAPEAGVVRIRDLFPPTGPALGLDDASPIALTWVKGTPAPAPIPRMVLNTGAGVLSWTAATPGADAWLSVAPTSGATPEGTSSPVTVSIAPGGLTAGLHLSSVLFTDTSGGSPSISVPVELTVENAPTPATLCVAGPSNLVFEHQLGAPPPGDVAFTLSNCGNPDLSLPWTVETIDGGKGWLVADVVAGELLPSGPPAEVRVGAVVSDVLSSGVHHGTVRFANSSVEGEFFDVPVTLTVALASFTVGDTLIGTIGAADDEDAAAFFGVQGMVLRVKVNGEGSPLKPWVAVTDEGGVEIKRWNLKGKGKVWKKSLTLPSSGVFQLRVGGRKGSVGGFAISTGRKLPGAAKPAVWWHQAPLPGTPLTEVQVLALPGAILSANLTPEGIPLESLGVSLITPAGAEYDLGAFAAWSSGMIHLVKVPLGQPGAWRIRATGLTPDAAVTVKTYPIQPGAGSSTVSIDG